MDFISNLFGYLLNFIYEIVGNYGWALILFTLVLRVIILPLTYKQQVTMRKSLKIQDKLKTLQFKYRNNPEMLNQETIALYKREKISPMSGCFSGIIQVIVLLSVFYLVSSPLTFMKKMDEDVVKQYIEEYTSTENVMDSQSAYIQINLIRDKGSEIEEIYINMDFLGLDLGLVPVGSLSDVRVYIIPLLYVVSSIISMKLSNNVTNKTKDNKSKEEEEVIEGQEGEQDNSQLEAMESMNKNMMYILPIVSVIIAMIAPLGLALYWLTNNVLTIVERVVINKILDKKEEEANA